MRQLIDQVSIKTSKLIIEAEYSDRGIGLEPLLQEFAYEPMLPPETAHRRVSTITSYYKEVLSRVGDVRMAYNITRKWALQIYVQNRVKQARQKAELPESRNVEYADFITRQVVRASPDKVFLFGDNLQHIGFGGQAKEMRGEPNVVGIPTKKKPAHTEDAYMSDAEYDVNVQHIDDAFAKIPQGKTVVIPKAGLGTGLAELPKRAPRTFAYLQQKLSKLSESINESAIDFPKSDLPEEVWDFVDGQYILKPDVKNSILVHLAHCPTVNMLDLACEIHLIGSLATNLYSDDSDLDIHIVPQESKLLKGADADAKIEAMKEWYKENVLDIAGHPLQVYIQTIPAQEYVGDSLYDVLKDEWLKGPKVYKLDFNPYTTFADILDEVEKISQGADVKIGDLRRDVVDYSVLKKAYDGLPSEYRTKIKQMLEDKLGEINQQLEDLLDDREGWVKARRLASSPESIGQALGDPKIADEWREKNVLFKFLDRYGYLNLMTQIKDVLGEDEQLDPSDINKIGNLLNTDSESLQTHKQGERDDGKGNS